MIYLGGSPYNAACRVAMENDKCGIVTGVSLPMLVEVINYRLCNGENANVQRCNGKSCKKLDDSWSSKNSIKAKLKAKQMTKETIYNENCIS